MSNCNHLTVHVEKTDGKERASPLVLDVPPVVSAPSLPQSPTSSMPTTILNISGESLITAIVLCYWDNILGPRIKHLWLPTDECSDQLTDTLRFIANHTLAGEICRDPTDSHVHSKLFVFKDRGVAVNSYVFGAFGGGDFGVHSLSLVISDVHLKRFVQRHELCQSGFLLDVAHLRVLMHREENDAFAVLMMPHFRRAVHMFQSLNKLCFPLHISESEHEPLFGVDSGVDTAFLSRAISSHLVTCSTSLVIGRKASKINAMLATLGLFLSPSERQCSRFVSEEQHWSYCPDLFLQGILQTSSSNDEVLIDDVSLHHLPTTLVDMNTASVKFTSLLHQHHTLRDNTVQQHLSTLWMGHSKSHSTLLRDMFHVFDEPETLVTSLVEELALLPANSRIVEAYVSQFITGLEKKALALIHYVQSETGCGKHPGRLSLKKLKQDLSLKFPGDFLIVLARAEKLKPGMYHFIMADPKVVKND